MTRFNPLRFLVLVCLLIAVAIYVQEQRLSTTSWTTPLEVVIFPLSADDARATKKYLANLSDSRFEPVGRFLAREAKRHGLALDQPFRITLGARPSEQPPHPPQPDGSLLSHLGWNIRFRIWAWRHTPDDESNFRRVRIFVVYHQPAENLALPDSVGVQKGLLGVVHAFANPEIDPRNNIVIAHEILHTVGATDKYQPDGQPKIPEGLADPGRVPLFPQTRAEIMAGYIARDLSDSVSPGGLHQCVVGPTTAREIGWVSPD